MRLLLDTHIALWAIFADPKLSKAARSILMDPGNQVCVSAASIWEITIKHQSPRGKLEMPVSGHEVLQLFRAATFQFVPITPEHAAAVAALPMIHRDPFDRLIIAQAMLEPMRLLTHDAVVKSYSDSIILV